MTVHTREYIDAQPQCREHGLRCPITLIWQQKVEETRIDRVSERAWDEADDWGTQP
jgi:hypothetical protein